MKSIGKHIWAFAVSIASKLYDSKGSSGSPASSVTVDYSESSTGYAKTLTTDGNVLSWVDSTYTHEQAGASSEWVVKHNLNKFPSVTIVTSVGAVVIGNITYDSANQLTISIADANSGKAYLN